MDLESEINFKQQQHYNNTHTNFSTQQHAYLCLNRAISLSLSLLVDLN